ncbi:MAG: glutaredoxin domain-containing protein [Planctomycetota bacterium]
MTIEVYSKQGCGICSAAKEKLELLGLDFKAVDLQEAITPHAGWREDETVEIMAGYAMIDNHLPLIRIEGKFHSYPSAMRRLKSVEPVGTGEKVH